MVCFKVLNEQMCVSNECVHVFQSALFVFWLANFLMCVYVLMTVSVCSCLWVWNLYCACVSISRHLTKVVSLRLWWQGIGAVHLEWNNPMFSCNCLDSFSAVGVSPNLAFHYWVHSDGHLDEASKSVTSSTAACHCLRVCCVVYSLSGMYL